MAEVDHLCETIDLRALPAYWAVVGERTAAVVRALTRGALDSVISPKELEWAIADERMLSGPMVSRPQELWAEMTRGFFLMYRTRTRRDDRAGMRGIHEMGGTDATRFYTEADGWCWFFGAIDHHTDEVLGWHVGTAVHRRRLDQRGEVAGDHDLALLCGRARMQRRHRAPGSSHADAGAR